jgi:pyruvate ferredoxin oxidoreductase beta subunit
LLAPGHRACAGCAMPTTIRLVLDAAGPNTIVVSPTSCLEVTTTPFPESAWCVPDSLLIRECGAVASALRSCSSAGD